MFVILCYDVNQERVAKVMRTCRKYLTHVQRSVFEGNLTEAMLKSLKKEIAAIIDTESDSVCLYHMESVRCVRKEQIGRVLHQPTII